MTHSLKNKPGLIDGKLPLDNLPVQPTGLIGEIRLLPFRKDDLPIGWYIADGGEVPADSSIGQALLGLPDTYKADWRIIYDGSSVTKPNMYHTDNRGMFPRPVKEEERLPGSTERESTVQIGEWAPDTSLNVVSASAQLGESITDLKNRNNLEGTPPSDNAIVYTGVGANTTLINSTSFGGVRPLNIGMTPAVYLGV